MGDESNTRGIDRILIAACEIANEQGTDALTTRAVAQRAQVSPALVHHHYINKEGLVDACIEVMYSKLTELLPGFHEGFRQSKTVGDFIELATRRIFRITHEHQAMVRMLMMNTAQTGQLDPARMDHTQKPFFAMVAPVLAGATGLSPAAVRTRIQCITFAIARFAIASEQELELVMGSTDPQAVEDQLVPIARALFSGNK